MDDVRVLPCGDRALLLELTEDGVRGTAAAPERAPLPGQTDVVPAARTVLVRLDRAPTGADLAALRGLRPVPGSDGAPAPEVVLDVVFDGPDLAEAARSTGRDALADHPVTGGHPVLAVVRTADLGAAAQLRPGDSVRFRPAR